MGTALTQTGNIDPSRRMNQSSSTTTGRPVQIEWMTGHSSTGYGDPSGRL